MIYPSVLIGAGVVMRADVGVDLLNVIASSSAGSSPFRGAAKLRWNTAKKKVAIARVVWEAFLGDTSLRAKTCPRHRGLFHRLGVNASPAHDAQVPN